VRLLVTRPSPDGDELADLLRAQGHEAVLEPLLTIEPVTTPDLDLAGVQALLATSANGVRALAAAEARRDVPLFAVGDATARTAVAEEFRTVVSADGDVDDLARLIAGRLDPAAGALLHAAGTALAGDLGGYLEAAGFTYRRAVLYRARPCEALSSEATRAITDGRLDGVVFFSPRTASSFVTLATAAGVTEACGRLMAFCLSRAVATAVGSIDWSAVEVAERPDQTSLLGRIEAFDQNNDGG
jgi:uroporphyrinogen-III synthase